MQEYPEFPTIARGAQGGPIQLESWVELGIAGDQQKNKWRKIQSKEWMINIYKYDKFKPFPTSNTHLTILFEPFRTHFGG